MESQALADKIAARVDYMILQYLPAPTCANKQAAHKQLVADIKKRIAEQLSPINKGLNIEIKL